MHPMPSPQLPLPPAAIILPYVLPRFPHTRHRSLTSKHSSFLFCSSAEWERSIKDSPVPVSKALTPSHVPVAGVEVARSGTASLCLSLLWCLSHVMSWAWIWRCSASWTVLNTSTPRSPCHISHNHCLLVARLSLNPVYVRIFLGSRFSWQWFSF